MVGMPIRRARRESGEAKPTNSLRPPFPAGNAMSVSNGTRSPRIYGEVARRLAADLLEDRPDLAAYPEAVAALCTAEAQVALFRMELERVGIADGEGKVRTALLQQSGAAERRAAQFRATLGLDPVSEAKLGRDRAATGVMAADLAAIASHGAQAWAEQRPTPDIAGEVLNQIRTTGRTEFAELQAAHNAKTTTTDTTGEDDTADGDTEDDKDPTSDNT